ncbi:EF-hand domain-containing protein [uncultured Piscinibacter sp.]|uniref:EF-hand domain-containing protein n=1 Tax=uncultured Piscinibacter sp. TaxID=1131835 RepID=UPI0026169B76|nr:EF-hand domain-containing protein [uncultured Piscinibacter sp.]
MPLRASLIRFTLAAACTGLAVAGEAQPAAPVTTDAKGRMAIEAAFSKTDVNGDGKVSKDEAAGLPVIAGQFDSLDEDRDGTLTLAEFAAGYHLAGHSAPRASFSLFQ